MSSRVAAMHKVVEALGPSIRSPNNFEHTKMLVKLLGLEKAMSKLRMVHIAGTKGKGTTSTYTAALLQHVHKKRVGVFTSPHVVDVRERMRVNGRMVEEERFAKYFMDLWEEQREVVTKLRDQSEAMLRLSEEATKGGFFRFTFLLALKVFYEERCSDAVMEVGIGGRIDSTNVITPVCCGITSLGWDHMDVLGDTIVKIAGEKAGIIKPGVRCFSCPQKLHSETIDVLRTKSKAIGAPFTIISDRVIDSKDWPRLAIGGWHARGERAACNCTFAVFGWFADGWSSDRRRTGSSSHDDV